MIPMAVVVAGPVAEVEIAVAQTRPARFAADTCEQNRPLGVIAWAKTLWVSLVSATVVVVVHTVAALIHAPTARKRTTRSIWHIHRRSNINHRRDIDPHHPIAVDPRVVGGIGDNHVAVGQTNRGDIKSHDSAIPHGGISVGISAVDKGRSGAASYNREAHAEENKCSAES